MKKKYAKGLSNLYDSQFNQFRMSPDVNKFQGIILHSN